MGEVPCHEALPQQHVGCVLRTHHILPHRARWVRRTHPTHDAAPSLNPQSPLLPRIRPPQLASRVRRFQMAVLPARARRMGSPNPSFSISARAGGSRRSTLWIGLVPLGSHATFRGPIASGQISCIGQARQASGACDGHCCSRGKQRRCCPLYPGRHRIGQSNVPRCSETLQPAWVICCGAGRIRLVHQSTLAGRNSDTARIAASSWYCEFRDASSFPTTSFCFDFRSKRTRSGS